MRNFQVAPGLLFGCGLVLFSFPGEMDEARSIQSAAAAGAAGRIHFGTRADHRLASIRSTFPKPAGRTASPRLATSTPSTRSPSTRLERWDIPRSFDSYCDHGEGYKKKVVADKTTIYRPRCLPRVSVVTTESRAVTVVRPSLSSTRRPRPRRRSSCVWSAQSARARSSWL